MNQQIRCCKSFDGACIAFAITGDGTPLVRAPHWLTHLEYEMSEDYALLRMDERAWSASRSLATRRAPASAPPRKLPPML